MVRVYDNAQYTGRRAVLPKRIKKWYLNYDKPSLILVTDLNFEEYASEFFHHYTRLNCKRPWEGANIDYEKIEEYCRKYVEDDDEYVGFFTFLIETFDQDVRRELRKDRDDEQEASKNKNTGSGNMEEDAQEWAANRSRKRNRTK